MIQRKFKSKGGLKKYGGRLFLIESILLHFSSSSSSSLSLSSFYSQSLFCQYIAYTFFPALRELVRTWNRFRGTEACNLWIVIGTLRIYGRNAFTYSITLSQFAVEIITVLYNGANNFFPFYHFSIYLSYKRHARISFSRTWDTPDIQTWNFFFSFFFYEAMKNVLF